MTREGIKIHSDILIWAIEESQIDPAKLFDKFPLLPKWMNGEKYPTFKQLELFSNALHIPFGYLFLDKPPQKKVIETSFRTIGNDLVHLASKNLQDTLLDMERIVQWMREYRVSNGDSKLNLVGYTQNKTQNPKQLAITAFKMLGLDTGWNLKQKDYQSTFKLLRDTMEQRGILIIINGVVGSNTHRPLNLQEFRAFTLIDDYSPLIFINGKDSAAGRIFSLVHEYFHILLGVSGLFSKQGDSETVCNRAAIEFLAPEEYIRAQWTKSHYSAIDKITELSAALKISKYAFVLHAKQLQLNGVDEDTVLYFKKDMESNIQKKKGSGGDYWHNALFRLSPPFVEAVIAEARSGGTPYTEALGLLGLKKMSTLDECARRLYT